MTSVKACLDVAAGAVLSADKSEVLLALRRADQHQGNLWEFPGGKLEANETAEQALRRELHEEIGIYARSITPLLIVEHEYVDKAVRLHVFTVEEFRGEPQSLEGQPLQWVALAELRSYAFPAANTAIVDALLSG